MRKKLQAVYRLLGSRLATLIGVTVFVALAARIAFTKVYPLPYDESFHFGLIQLYTHHLNPFLTSQPASADALGAVARDPSYLYHYLMSFPLRFISLVAHTTIEQVVALRVLNIGLGVMTLLLFRKLARRFGASVVASNIAVLALAITPVFYDLSGQINYDNLLIPLTLLVLLATWSVADVIKQGRVPVVRLLQLSALLLLASLVKYTFLPIMAVVCVYILGLLINQGRKGLLAWSTNWKSWPVVLGVVMLVIASGLWAQRYGVDMVAYHTPHPQCGVVLDLQSCSQYAPWYRNYLYQQSYSNHPVKGLQFSSFTMYWLRSMYYGVYSTVHTQAGQVLFSSVSAVRIAAKTMLIIALLYVVLRWHKARGHGVPWVFLTSVGLVYAITLWGQNFSDFHNLGALVGIQGRYLLPLVPIVYAVAARMFTLLAEDLQPAHLRETVTEYIVVGMLTVDQVHQFTHAQTIKVTHLFHLPKRTSIT